MDTGDIELKKRELLKLLKKDAYIEGKVTLSSGKTSDYYIDARRVTLNATGAYLCGRIILDLLKNEPFDAIGGPTLGADPLIGAIGVLSFQANKPINTFIVRKTPKVHGKQQRIEGPLLKKGTRVVLIDDVATTGKALIESIDVLAQIGVQVQKAICIVDRLEGAKEALAEKDCPLISIFNISDIRTSSN